MEPPVLGDARTAIERLLHGLALNQHNPQNFIWYNVLALAGLLDGNAETGLRSAG